MKKNYTEENYSVMIESLFNRFPSFQKTGSSAYKPGIDNMLFADQLMGHPHRNYGIIHVAGTNGKGSVSNMLASVLAAEGLKVGLYTSPHILDFRERIRYVSDSSFTLISRQEVWDFIMQWNETFDHLDMSFFEITTLMAFDWFARQNVDIAVVETGLGGRLDSTNIVTPLLSVISNIGFDHCDLLGASLPEIAFEKAGIIKPRVPVVIGESNHETDPVFERKVLYTNLSEPEYMGNRTAIMSLLDFADKAEPSSWNSHEELLRDMDLKGEYQKANLRTVLTALDVLERRKIITFRTHEDSKRDALIHTAGRCGFRGRWELLSEEPLTICDIGHNEHGLRHNFSQLAGLKATGEISDVIMVYGTVADKDVDAVLRLIPEAARCIFTQAPGKRSMPAAEVRDRYECICRETGRAAGETSVCEYVADALAEAYQKAAELKSFDASARPLIYIGGSTYVVSEAVKIKKM